MIARAVGVVRGKVTPACGVWKETQMSIVHRRLILIVTVVACLLGLTGTGALAALSMRSNPSEATQNSIWNIIATWQDAEGVAPVLDRTSTSEPRIDYGLSGDGWGPTIGTARDDVPLEWSDGLFWWPAVPAPDGFIGFAPQWDIINDEPLDLEGEVYQPWGFATLQPDPMSTVIETDGDPGFGHAVDFVHEEIVQMVKPTIADGILKPIEVEWPDAEGNLPAPRAAREFPQRDQDKDKGIPARPKTPAFIQTSRVPVLLVGVWTDPARMHPVKARIANAASLKPLDQSQTEEPFEDGWPGYNVIEILEKDENIAGVGNFYVSYYTPGTHYVITRRAPLPMPYTVYSIPLAVDGEGVPYLPINDAILSLDPKRTGDLNDPALTPDNSPVLGIYADREGPEGADPTNYFDLTVPDQPAVRYEAPNTPGTAHPTFGKLFFTVTPADVTPGRIYYVTVSTDAVDGVYPSQVPSPADNLYLNPDEEAIPRKIGYCAKSGVIRLAIPAEEPQLASVGRTLQGVEHFAKTCGKQLWTQYRALSNNSFTVGRTSHVGIATDVSSVSDYTSADSYPVRGRGRVVIDTKSFLPGTFAVSAEYWPVFPMVDPNSGLLDPMGVVWYKGRIPMHYRGPDGVVEGAKYGVSVSAGLKMSNPEQWPDPDVTLNQRTRNNKLIYDDRGWPMYYDPDLTGSEAPPAQRRLTCIGYGVKDRRLLSYEVKSSDNVNVTVHTGATALACYSDSASMPANPDVDPLAVEIEEEATQDYPDDGSSSTHFIFRVRYVRNSTVGVLPPLPWLRPEADEWNPYGNFSSGVVLYLDEKGTGDYKPHFMYPDYENNGLGANIYMYRVMPHNSLRLVNTPHVAPWAFQSSSWLGDYDSDLYQSLKMGVYNYFFATTSDSLRFIDSQESLSSFAFEHQNPDPMDPTDPFSKTGLEEWGQIASYPYYSTGLDPSAPRAVTGYPAVDRPAGRRYSSNGATPGDTTLYFNRSVRVPGMFESVYKYQYPANMHPEVTCELSMPSNDDLGKRYDHEDYGQGRFFGTLFPFRTALNAAHQGCVQEGNNAFLAETSGSLSTDTNVFRIFYRQKDNLAPIEIRLWINDASEKSGNTPAHQYRSYTMYRRPDQTNPDYREGVWYEYKLDSGSAQLPHGPHTYYFTAFDGYNHARWPVRPDQYTINWPGPDPDPVTMNVVDGWVPTFSYAYDRRNEGYFDNDYVPGPYVNRPPVISNVSVTPSAGKEGTHFVFRATYSDPDGHRPYSAKITIQVSENAPPRTIAMKVDPKHNIDPLADNRELYKAGVDFILDSATVADLALAKGVRKFFVTFTDDWGRQNEPNDRRVGESSRYPSGEDNWVEGPVISGNSPPTLSGGQVTSTDNTSNSATVWQFKVNYRDLDRDPPAMIKVYIGRLQPMDITTPTPSTKVRTIIWDAGHTMLPTNPSDTVYSHGVEFAYQTRLAGPDTTAPQMVTKKMTISSDATEIDPDPDRTGDIIRVWKVYTDADPNRNYYSYTGATPPEYVTGMIALNAAIPAGDIWVQYERRPAVQYYYAFEAHDGFDFATYKSSADANVRSDSAGCFIRQDAECVDTSTYQRFKIRPKIARSITIPAATNVIDPDPDRVGDIIRIWGVYDNEDLTGTNYYPLPDGQAVPDNYDNVTHPGITLAGTIPAGRVWLLVEADTPLVGPMPIAAPAPAGVIPDPEVFINFQQNGKPELITDQKNGFVDEVNGQVDHAVAFMSGRATYNDRPSGHYVAPDVIRDVASVEGVYWLSNPDVAHQYDNYYDPAKLLAPMVREAVSDDNYPQAFVQGPDEIYKVLGVYDNPELKGINYYAGDQSMLKWQPARTISNWSGSAPNVIWPTKPNDIAVIQGVYLSMNVQHPAGNFYEPDGFPDPPFVVPANVDLGTGAITIDPMYNTAGVIQSILRINERPDMSGQDYFISANPEGDPYDPEVPLFANQPEGDPQPPATSPVYVSYVPARNFGPGQEFIPLRKELPSPLPDTVYIAYYAPGDLNADGGIDLAIAPEPGKPLYAKIWAKGYNPGDRYIRLTTPLPDFTTTGTVVNAGLVRPAAEQLADMAEVTGVFVEGDSTNYYKNTANPFQLGDTQIFLGTSLPEPLPATVTVKYLPRERNVTIKYCDMRFTHTFKGSAAQISSFYFSPFTNELLWVNTVPGTTHFRPDGALAGSSNITGNAPLPSPDGPIARDVDGGLVGVWQNPEFTGPNYFNPRRTGLYPDNPSIVRLSTEVPVGTGELYARGYQKGTYYLDRWNRDLRFEPTKTLTGLDRVQVSYFFGTKMKQVLVPNTRPILTEGKVTPLAGTRNTQYVYSVKYKDVDGPTGQVPAYVRVYIDGTPYEMTPVSQGTPDYKNGAIFTFTPTGGLSGKPHTFYFEASDGGAVAWFDKLGSHNSERTIQAQDIVELDGPWVDDPPILTEGMAVPNPLGEGQGIDTGTSVDYYVTLTDIDNEPPYVFDPLRDLKNPVACMNVSGSPRVWIDADLTEDSLPPVTYTIVGLEADPTEITKMRVIRAAVMNADGTFMDPGWTTDQYAGKLLQITNGKDWTDISPSPYSTVYLIQSNTSNKLVLAVDDLANEKLYPVPPDPAKGTPRYAQFRINGLLMAKADPGQVDNWATGITYKVTVPRLPVGMHRFRFTARTREEKPDWLLALPQFEEAPPYSNLARFPDLGDAQGPNVIAQADPGNVAPQLLRDPDPPGETLYRGPQAQHITMTSPNRAVPSDYGKIRKILGVFRNANFDAHLSPSASSPEDQPKDFYDKANTPDPFNVGHLVALTPNMYPCPDTMTLVQRSSMVEDSRTVVPAVPGAIGTVLGVYLDSDPTLTSIYNVASPTLVGGKITLSDPLPVGTSDVYITYKPRLSSMTLQADGSGSLPLSTPNAIAYIKDAYLESDPDKTNLVDLASWVPGDETIAYSSDVAVPTAGQNVVVDYVPWPPAYLKFYAKEPPGSPSGNPKLHGTFKAGEPLTFTVFYRDANGDRPTYHDGVQGYVRLVFNGLGRTAQLSALEPPQSYTDGVRFGVTLTDVPPGTHAYHFEASDGYAVTRFPALQGGAPSQDEKVRVNNMPVLSNGGVDHSSGATTFTFSVTYRDADNVPPADGGFVKALLRSVADPDLVIDPIVMTPVNTNWSSNVGFTGTIDARTAVVGGQPVGLPVGAYTVLFVANDGIQDAAPLVGPQITVRAPDPDHRPYITEYQVYKLLGDGSLDDISAGKTSDTFVYRARYKDSYDEAPVAVINGERLTAMSLIIDGDFAHPIAMTMVPMSGTPDYTGADNDRWPWWEARITGKQLKGGNHSYTVRASDGTVNAVFEAGVPEIKYGPTLMIPYFSLQVVGKDGSAVSGGAIVGQEVLIKGQMYFPYIESEPGLRPNDLDNIVIQITKPDATVISIGANLVMREEPVVGPTSTNWVGDLEVTYSGYVDPALSTGSSLTLVASGKWVIDASWPGDSTYDGASTDATFDQVNDQVQINVSGPSRTVATLNPLAPDTSAPVVDMITPPMMIGSSDPSKIFGPDRALTMQIVKWQPSTGQYFRYDFGGYFPPLRPGDAIWIKPKLSAIPGTGYPAAEPITRQSVEGGWTALDNPAVQKAEVGGVPRYLTSNYRLVKVLAQAYPLLTNQGGTVVVDNATQLPLLKPCTIPLSAGWNQFGCIFYNWKRDWQVGTAEGGGELPPPPPGGTQSFGTVTPSDPDKISRVLGVYTTPSPTIDDFNYYQPGVATTPYAKGDDVIHLTRELPPGVTTVYIKYEAYPKEDVGIPFSELRVSYMGTKKTLAEAKQAGWITDYAWRYDAITNQYVAVSATRPGAERVLKAWSGYWIRAYVNCELEVDPNTTFNGVIGTAQASSPVRAVASKGMTATSTAVQAEEEEMLPPPPAPRN